MNATQPCAICRGPLGRGRRFHTGICVTCSGELQKETARDDVSMQMEYADVAREDVKCARPGCGHTYRWHHLDWDPVHCTFTGLDEYASCDCPAFVEPMALPVGWSMTPLARCDRRGCKADAVAEGTCQICANQTYRRCAAHDGEAGIKRSLHSHAALHHPKYMCK